MLFESSVMIRDFPLIATYQILYFSIDSYLCFSYPWKNRRNELILITNNNNKNYQKSIICSKYFRGNMLKTFSFVGNQLLKIYNLWKFPCTPAIFNKWLKFISLNGRYYFKFSRYSTGHFILYVALYTWIPNYAEKVSSYFAHPYLKIHTNSDTSSYT